MIDIKRATSGVYAAGRLMNDITAAAIRLADEPAVREAIKAGKEVIVDVDFRTGEVRLITNPSRVGEYLAKAERVFEPSQVTEMPWPHWCHAMCEAGAQWTDFIYKDDIVNEVRAWLDQL